MNDITLNEIANTKKSNLTVRFVVTGIIAIVLIVSAMTLRGYYVLRVESIENESQRVSKQVSEIVTREVGSDITIEQHHLIKIATLLGQLEGFRSIDIYNENLQAIISDRLPIKLEPLNTHDHDIARILLRTEALHESVVDLNFTSLKTWLDVSRGNTSKLVMFIKLKKTGGPVFGLAKINYNFERTLNYVEYFSQRVFLFSILCLLALFLALYFTFQRGIKTIRQQETKLNKQITSLYKLLSINQGMQQSMKTASARAVELNEQFLRRVGADLHDGPAQMIGFAVLRLSQISKQQAALEFSPEFHAVKNALDEALDDIRGISSGLVLPELEALSLEQCLRQVATLHRAKSKADVSQYYQSLPKNIPLPIKISAYRFIQEGLNNAHSHGKAKNCQLSAYVEGQTLVISLKDNGIGFMTSKLSDSGRHLGLKGLKDRVESIGGQFSINSELDVGTVLHVTFNLTGNE